VRVNVGWVGWRGLALLTATGVVGLILGAHGWSARHPGLPAGSLASGARPAAGPAPSAAPSASGSAGHRAPRGHGPLLSSEPYARLAYQVWPGSRTAAARTALTGLKISVHRQGSGISVTAAVIGQPFPAPRLYPLGERVYVVESALGDDSGDTDYNLGDDGLVVTTAQGVIIR
jgi:hypothetical protein